MDPHDGECDDDCVWNGWELSANDEDFVWTGNQDPISDTGESLHTYPWDGYYIDGEKTIIAWSQIDYISLFLDGAGMLGDVSLIATAVGFAPGPFVWVGSEVLEGVGVGYNVYNAVIKDDYSSGETDFFFWGLEEMGGGKLVPLIGFYFNIRGVAENVGNAIITVDDLKPIPEP